MARRKGIPGLSFSWKRALGVSSAKGQLSRQIGIPLTRSGRQRKVGQALGCCIPFILILISSIMMATLVFTGGDVFAHGGGLDASGGHNDRKHGGYHYHRGGPQSRQANATRPTDSTTKSATTNTYSNRGTFAGTASVIDGDTIDIHGQRIRLHGIDAPESAQTCTSAGTSWRCGAEAANKLSEKIGRQTVICDKRDTDRYGRAVAVCTVAGQDINEWLVSEGLAVAYRQYSSDYIGKEDEAKGASRGIWASEFDMPWDWRKARK